MKKRTLRLISVGISMLLLATTLLPTLADSATNDTTGADSSNTTNVTNTNEVVVENVSDTRIRNEIRSTSNSGNNSASRNTMGGTVMTGDADTHVAVENRANINTTGVEVGGNNGSNTAGNSITGADSDNFSDIFNRNMVNVRNDNTAVIRNEVNASSNTGGNFANRNTEGVGGAVMTGDADTDVDLYNRANDSATSVSGLSDFGDNVVGNSTTGADSTNVANVGNENEVRVRNVSDALVRNRVRARATTGENSASRNTMGGAVDTGDADVGIEMETDGNITTTSVDNGMAGMESFSGNEVTGADSGNFTTMTNRNVFRVNNWNNKGRSTDAPDYEDCFQDECEPFWGVDNMDVDVSNTGGNWANRNTYPSSVLSGAADVGKYIRTCLNDTMTTIGGMFTN
jgi:hypothetical protein